MTFPDNLKIFRLKLRPGGYGDNSEKFDIYSDVDGKVVYIVLINKGSGSYYTPGAEFTITPVAAATAPGYYCIEKTLILKVQVPMFENTMNKLDDYRTRTYLKIAPRGKWIGSWEEKNVDYSTLGSSAEHGGSCSDYDGCLNNNPNHKYYQYGDTAIAGTTYTASSYTHTNSPAHRTGTSTSQVAKYYYYPGWHEPGPTLETIINKEAYDSLPKDLQAILKTASRAINQDMLDEYTSRNNQALISLVNDHNVELRKLPNDVLAEFKRITEELLVEMTQEDESSKKIYESLSNFKKNVSQYHEISEEAIYELR